MSETVNHSHNPEVKSDYVDSKSDATECLSESENEMSENVSSLDVSFKIIEISQISNMQNTNSPSLLSPLPLSIAIAYKDFYLISSRGGKRTERPNNQNNKSESVDSNGATGSQQRLTKTVRPFDFTGVRVWPGAGQDNTTTHRQQQLQLDCVCVLLRSTMRITMHMFFFSLCFVCFCVCPEHMAKFLYHIANGIIQAHLHARWHTCIQLIPCVHLGCCVCVVPP